MRISVIDEITWASESPAGRWLSTELTPNHPSNRTVYQVLCRGSAFLLSSLASNGDRNRRSDEFKGSAHQRGRHRELFYLDPLGEGNRVSGQGSKVGKQGTKAVDGLAAERRAGQPDRRALESPHHQRGVAQEPHSYAR